MAEIKTGVARLVDAAIEKRASEKEARSYMGASVLGKDCSRELWYTYHMPMPITDPRVNRIFEFGNLLEDYVIKLLRDAGLQVFTEDENGEQFGFIDGEVAGHIDGVITGLPESTRPHLLEIKSASNKNFNKFVNDGYEHNAGYKTQVHVYMYQMNLENCLAVVINKDNSEMYFERIKLDAKYAKRQILRGKEVVNISEPPIRPYAKSTFWKCRICNYNEKCWGSDD